jgi:hypothetical protein
MNYENVNLSCANGVTDSGDGFQFEFLTRFATPKLVLTSLEERESVFLNQQIITNLWSMIHLIDLLSSASG